MATHEFNGHAGKLGSRTDICPRRRTKPPLYEECRLHFWTIAVSNFVSVQSSKLNRLQPGQFHKLVQLHDKTLMTRICQLYQTGGITGDQGLFVRFTLAAQRSENADRCCCGGAL